VLILRLFTAVVLAGVCLFWSVGAVRTWRGERDFSTHPFFRVQPQRRKDNIDRCVVAVALVLFFLAGILVESIFFAANAAQTPEPVGAATAVSFLGLVLATVLALLVRAVNRPKFIVPRHLRARPGTIALARRAKRDLRRK
jgi:hypothetical protein